MLSRSTRDEKMPVCPGLGPAEVFMARDTMAMPVAGATAPDTRAGQPCPALWLVALAFFFVQPAVAQTPNPPPPTALHVTSASASVIHVSWTAPSNDGHGAIAAYNVFRCVERTSACEPQWHDWQDSSAGTSYTDTQVTAETTYRYAVGSMRYLGGEPGEKSDWSNQVTSDPGSDTGSGDGTNLAVNGSFEDGSSGWNLWGGATLDESDAAHGQFSVRATRNNGAEQTVTGLQPNVILTEGSGSTLTLVWSDEFNGSGPVDSSKWGFERGFVRNREVQWYQAANAFQANGHLVIEGRRQTFANPDYIAGSTDWKTSREFVNHTSASLFSLQQWQYSKIVVRAKVTNRTGTWPAIWTLGASCEWPSNGEVDIMENYGGNVLANFAWGTGTRWQPVWDSASRSVSSLGSNWTDDFHTWELNWDENRMSIYLDGVLLNDRPLGDTINGFAACAGQNPFKQPHYLLLNLALGGSQGGSVENLTFPTRYLVDYVRVYSREPEQGDQTTPPEEEPLPPAGNRSP